jgi:hypothetical protein
VSPFCNALPACAVLHPLDSWLTIYLTTDNNYPLDNNTQVPEIPDVGSYSPAGDSPYGLTDAVGLLWQLTDEFIDPHTQVAGGLCILTHVSWV